MTITATTNPPYSDGTDGILNGKNVRAPNTTTYVSYSWTAGISPTQGTPGVVLLGWGSCSESWKLDCDTSYRLARPATYGGTPYNPQQDFTITVSGTPSGVATGGYWEYNYDQYRAGVNDSNLWYRSNSAIVGPANGQYDILEFQYVAPAAVTNWNYVPKIATTPSAGTVSPGSTITVSTRAQNTPATMTGADHGHRIRISSGSENVTVISNSGDESTSTKPSTIAWGWSGLPGITAGNYSAYKTLSFTVNSNAANGSQVCFEGGVNNRIGDSVNGVTTAEYAFTSSVCFTVSVPVTTSWEYLPQINGAGGTVNPGATIAVTAYNYNSTTSNGETGSGYIQRLNITSNAGLVSVMSGIGNYPADNEPTPGVVWAWGGQPGLAPGANSFSTGKTLYFQVSGSATTGSQICFKSAVNNFTGTNGTTTSAGFRESAYAICYTVNVPAATTFWNYVPSISGTVSGTPAPNGYVLNLDPNNPDVGNSIVIAGNAYNSFTTANNGMTGLNYDLAIAPYGTGADDLIKVAGSATQSGTYWLWSGLPGIPAGGSGTTQALAFRVNVATVTSGDRICFVTGVSPYAGDSVGNISSGTSYSNEICYTINLLPTIDPIRPYLVVNKAGVWAGGAIDNFGAIDPINAPCSGVNLNIVSAITSVADNTLGKGSYADYDVTATGPISGFGSYGSITGTGLTFANDPPLGNFSSEGRCITNFYDLLYDLAAAGYPGISFGGSTLPVYTVPAGADSIILIDGKVTIEGNRTYVTSYTQPGGTGVSSIDQIPFAMVVVNGDIDIKSNVTKLDGLYMATGTIDTCSDAPSTPSGVSIFCNEQLLINGAFIANHINFSRTHGGLHTLARSTDPAEVFQFSPEMYLGAPNIPIPGLGEYTIDQFKDLPAVY